MKVRETMFHLRDRGKDGEEVMLGQRGKQEQQAPNQQGPWKAY